MRCLQATFERRGIELVRCGCAVGGKWIHATVSQDFALRRRTAPHTMMKLTEGDLLAQDDVDAVVNAVNCVGVMGKTIALQFKHRWPANFGAYATACHAGQVRPGRMFIHDLGRLVQPNHIINFPTKEHWREESRIQFIKEGLVDLVAQVRRLGIRSIAIPPLGCGNGGLRWADVLPLIQAAFEPLPEVEVRLFEPDGSARADAGTRGRAHRLDLRVRRSGSGAQRVGEAALSPYSARAIVWAESSTRTTPWKPTTSKKKCPAVCR